MENINKKIFREKYSDHWLKYQDYRSTDRFHYQYQKITLTQLNCFEECSLFECGCGSGELLHRIAKTHPDMQLFGIDLGRKSLLSAKEGPLKNYDSFFIEGDVNSLPVRSNSYDRILASSVLWYLPEPEQAIAEMIRILKPGGQFVFDVRNPYHVTNLLTRLSLTLRRSISKPALKYSFYSPKKLSALLDSLPIEYTIVGYFVLLPTRLPFLGRRWGNLVSLSPWLSYQAGKGLGRWLAQKLLITGHKVLD